MSWTLLILELDNGKGWGKTHSANRAYDGLIRSKDMDNNAAWTHTRRTGPSSERSLVTREYTFACCMGMGMGIIGTGERRSTSRRGSTRGEDGGKHQDAAMEREKSPWKLDNLRVGSDPLCETWGY